MFTPGKHPPLYQQLADPMYAFNRGFTMNLAVVERQKAFWPGHRLLTSGALADVCRNQNDLAADGNPEVNYWNGIIPMLSFPANTDYWIASPSTKVSSQDSNVFWTWIRFNDVSAANRYICGRYDTPNHYSWSFTCTTPNTLSVNLSTDGTNITTFNKTVSAYTLTSWHFVAFEHYAATRVRIWIDDDMSEWTVGIPGALVNGNSTFRLGQATKSDMILPAWNGGEHYSNPTIDCRSWLNVWYTVTRMMV